MQHQTKSNPNILSRRARKPAPHRPSAIPRGALPLTRTELRRIVAEMID